MSANAVHEQPNSRGPNTKKDIAKSLQELDIIIARLRARIQYTDRPLDQDDQDASDQFLSFLDEMLEVHSTPSGVRIQAERGWGRGVAREWLSVGAYLRNTMKPLF